MLAQETSLEHSYAVEPSTAPVTADPWMKIASAGQASHWHPPNSWTTNASSFVRAKRHPLQRRLASSWMKSSIAETALWTGREHEMGTRTNRSPSHRPRLRHAPPRQKRHFPRSRSPTPLVKISVEMAWSKSAMPASRMRSGGRVRHMYPGLARPQKRTKLNLGDIPV